jgi:hypothetical protein
VMHAFSHRVPPPRTAAAADMLRMTRAMCAHATVKIPLNSEHLDIFVSFLSFELCTRQSSFHVMSRTCSALQGASLFATLAPRERSAWQHASMCGELTCVPRKGLQEQQRCL